MPPESPSPLPGKPVSLWIDSTPRTAFPRLVSAAADQTFDVVVLGGGIVGITAASQLVAAGLRVAVVESRRLLEGTTGNTTAKLTSLHGLKVRDLVRRHGDEVARLYVRANDAAIRHVEKTAREQRIDCELTEASAFTFAEDAASVPAIEEEARVLERLGVAVTLTTDGGLPFPTPAAVRCDQQAHFHPRKYLLALAQAIVDRGGVIVEETTATDVRHGDPCVVTTDRGTLRAKDVIVATHQPFLLEGAYFAKMTLRRSYVLAATVNGPVPPGMYISAEPEFHSMRPARAGRETLLLVGGEPHRTGQAKDTDALVRRLEAWARSRFSIRSVQYRWAAQDNVTADGLPYVGRVTGGSRHLLVATGFGGWGMTNGTAAGLLLADLVRGVENPYAHVYDPSRTGLAGTAAALARDAVVTVKDALGAFDPAKSPAHALEPGQARVLDFGFDKLAAYRDSEGRMHVVSASCTHLGCLVEWNAADRSWDCPCHGSRFDPDGQVLHGPATRPLPKEGEEAE